MSSKVFTALLNRKKSIEQSQTNSAPTPTPATRGTSAKANYDPHANGNHGNVGGSAGSKKSLKRKGDHSHSASASNPHPNPNTKHSTQSEQLFKKAKTSPTPPAPASSPMPTPTRVRQLSALQQKMASKLAGARFRWLNEKLYTCTSDEAYQYFQQHPEEFDEYHKGFGVQVKEWPVSPLDEFIQYLKSRPTLIAGDFGCGEARLAASVPNKVHSFDLVAHNERVVACNMSHVPLADGTLDVAIFCLSLMGVDFMSFIREAHRVLKTSGTLLVSEVRSRFEESGIDVFINAVIAVGFTLKRKDMKNQMFATLEFQKTAGGKNKNANSVQSPSSVSSSSKSSDFSSTPSKGGKSGSTKKGASASASTSSSKSNAPTAKTSFTHPPSKSNKKAQQSGDKKSNGPEEPVLTACIYKKR